MDFVVSNLQNLQRFERFLAEGVAIDRPTNSTILVNSIALKSGHWGE